MNLHHTITGHHPRHLYILHGLLGMADNWHLLARRYAEHFTVVTPDLRNHGRSAHTDEFSYELMVEDILELCHSIGSQNMYLMGHSMGGKVAMKLALQHPDVVDKLVVADMRPHAFTRGHDHIFKALFALDLSTLQTRGEAEKILAHEGITNAGEALFLLKNLGRDAGGKFIMKPNLQSLHKNYDQIIAPVSEGSFAKPVLFIRGGISKYILPEHYALIASLFPHWQLATIDAAGHWLHADAPDEYFNKTMLFLNS